MAIRKIRLVPDDILRKKSRPVEAVDGGVQELIQDMLETMYQVNGVGLAAVQVGVLKRVIVMDISENCDQPIVMINPELVHKEGTQMFREACLSIPGLSGMVERPALVVVKGLDPNGKPQELSCEGDLAVVMCHELDHLDGILYTDIATELFQPDHG